MSLSCWNYSKYAFRKYQVGSTSSDMLHVPSFMKVCYFTCS